MDLRIKAGHLLVMLAVGAAFLSRGILVLDPDFGWHLRMGQIISLTGVPNTDPFSYTMPSFPFVDHEWLTNWGIYKLYGFTGMTGLAIIGAGITVAALVIAAAGSKGKWMAVPVLLSAGVLIHRGGVRPQILDWVFLTLVLRLFEDMRRWDKWKWVWPAVMLLWANLHGGFPVGIAVSALILGLRAVQEKKFKLQDGVIWLTGLAATFANPNGWRLWQEVISQAALSGFFRKTIMEWQPFWAQAEMSYWILGTLAASVVYRYRERVKLWEAGLLAGLFLSGITALRHMSLFAVAAIPFTVKGFSWMEEEFGKEKEMKRRWQKFYQMLTVMAAVLFVVETAVDWKNALNMREGKFYPTEAVRIVEEIPISERVMAEYGWGGYLIWKIPDRKVFVDGRMAGWRWEAPEGESDWAFQDYLKVAEGSEGWEEVLDTNQVKWVLWGREEEQEDTGWLDRLIKGKFPEVVPLEKRLAEKGWIREYEDKWAVLFRRQGENK